MRVLLKPGHPVENLLKGGKCTNGVLTSVHRRTSCEQAMVEPNCIQKETVVLRRWESITG